MEIPKPYTLNSKPQNHQTPPKKKTKNPKTKAPGSALLVSRVASGPDLDPTSPSSNVLSVMLS